MKDECEGCKSENVYRDYYKIGTFVSHYKLRCRDCGFLGESRPEQG